MKVGSKTISYLKDIITGNSNKTPYLSGPQLVSFFNKFGFQDEYGKGFPSRWSYCEQKLLELNTQNSIEKIIEFYYNPINFIENKEQYKKLIEELNNYLNFDDLELQIENKNIKLFKKNHNKIKPNDYMNLINNLEKIIWEKYKDSEKIEIYFKQWIKSHDEMVGKFDYYERQYFDTEQFFNFNIIKTNDNIDVIKTLNNIKENELIKIAEDLGIIISDFFVDEMSFKENLISEATFSDNTISIILQKDIFEHVKSLLESQHYFNAVEEAYKIVRKKLKSITGKEKAHEGFKEDNYEIIFGHKYKDDVEKDFFDGVKFLHMAIQYLRNEKSHTPAKNIDKNLAIHYIVLASLAYDLINNNNQ